MKPIKKEDFEIKRQELFDKLSKTDQMWGDEYRLKNRAILEVLTEKINELVDLMNYYKADDNLKFCEEE